MLEFVLLGSSLLIALIVLWPALRTGHDEQWVFSAEDTPIGRLETRKEVLVGNIADLDFEFAMGKLAEDDYLSLRENLKRQTLKVMEQLEVIESSERSSAPRETDPATAPATAFCSACGASLPPRAAFCPSCGSAVGS
jgi:hypothetical protein